MNNLIHHAIIAALLILMASCSGKPAPVDHTADAASSDIPELTDEADSLAYFMGLGMAERLRDRISTDSALAASDYDPDLFMSGLRAILAVPAGHPGYRYGADHGSSLQNQAIIFRSVGLRISPDMVTAGFRRGIATDSTDLRPTATLDSLMSPVNSLLIRQKLLSHF